MVTLVDPCRFGAEAKEMLLEINPEAKILKFSAKIELRLLAAITNVAESKLIEIIERILEEKLRVSGITFVKESAGCGHELEPHEEHEEGQMPKVKIYRKNEWK